jgi:uncharacterized membrane protein YvbJ
MNNQELEENRNSRKNSRENDEDHLEKELNRFSISLIKIVGIAGVIIGLIILIVFWFWVLKKLF